MSTGSRHEATRFRHVAWRPSDGVAARGPRAAAAMPVVGFLDPRPPYAMTERVRAFRQGLKDTGVVEGEKVLIEYRWAENQIDRLPARAADLARRRVAVIAVPGGPDSALAAKAATPATRRTFVANRRPLVTSLSAAAMPHRSPA